MASIADYYAGKTIFITGGTGFIGKVLIEKLLYNCQKLEKIYVLIREKKGSSPYERLQEMTNKPVFTRIQNEMPEALDKIVLVTGNLEEPNFGIKPGMENSFIDKVSVVFHLAVSLNINQSIDHAINTNFEGTRRVLQLSKRMRNLEKFVHISTAYCHTDKEILEEVVYSLPFEFKNVDQDDAHVVYSSNIEFEAFRKSKPNNYLVAKAMAETLVANYSEVPTVIIRPSIITASLSEPVPGWVDNWMGATHLITTTATGLNRVLLGEKNNILDLIPIDYVSNLCVTAAADTNRNKKLLVYNCCSYSNPVTLGAIYEYLKEFSSKSGLNDSNPVFMVFVKREWALKILSILLEKIPAYISDTWQIMKGKKPRFVKLQSNVIKNRDLIKFFTMNSFPMKSDNILRLHNKMSPQDRKIFPFNPQSIQWNEYILEYCRGIKKYLLK